MATFTIDGSEYELKIDVNSIKAINKKYDTAMEFIGAVMTGGYDAYVDVVYFGLLHTNRGFNHARVETEVEKKLNAEELDLHEMMATGYEVVNDCFFFKKTVNKMLGSDPAMRKQFEELLNR